MEARRRSYRWGWPWWILAGLLVYLAHPGCARPLAETEHIRDVTEDEFTVLMEQEDGFVLLYFWAPWCGPCRALMPELDAVASEYSGEVLFVKINLDENKKLAQRFQVGPIPSVFLLYQGQPKAHFQGYHRRAQVKQWMDRYVAGDEGEG